MKTEEELLKAVEDCKRAIETKDIKLCPIYKDSNSEVLDCCYCSFDSTIEWVLKSTIK
jgi:biotin synthase-like enzyme